jgi:toxin ParE1/3/4
LKRTVLWSENAINDLNESIAYLAARNPIAARKVHAEINKAAKGLGAAATGRPGRVNGTYEKSVTGRPYIIAYALFPLSGANEGVAILHVIHTARDWPEGGWPE